MAIDLCDCRFDGDGRFDISKAPTSPDVKKDERFDYEERTAGNAVLMGQLQDRLYAEGREGLVVLLQAMDAAGKDSTIKHVMSGINPQGVTVHSFKQPSAEELSHDYLWRAVTHLPPRGQIALFNRSYYEDVLVVRVHALWRGYKMPERCTNDSERQFFGKRYRQIRDFEEYLYENGYRVLKIFLNVSPEQQRLRFLERIDDQSKNWKFSGSDIAERKLWPSYMRAYEDAINGTATKHAPWFVIPADKKWFARWLVSEAIVDVLRQMDPRYPELPQDQRDKLADYKAQLLSEDGPRGE
jgi:PPK2 family polyphosphate:nucleotide phosphotransferase